MRGDMNGVQLYGYTQMLRRLFIISTFLKNLVAQAIPAEKSLGVLGDHLTKGFDIHVTTPERGHIISSPTSHRPDETIGGRFQAPEAASDISGLMRKKQERTGWSNLLMAST